MGRRISVATAVLAVAAALLAVLLAAVPAVAHHKDEHLQGGGKAEAAEQDDKAKDAADEGDNAHPSGKDRSIENGGSGTQGKSESDPDDDGKGPDHSNGGPDKPGGSGGIDQGDQDGNNGCGNDDDFEDDNEGWCGRKPKPAKPAGPAGAVQADVCDDATMSGTKACKDDELETGVLPTVPCPEGEDMASEAGECGAEEEVAHDVITRPATTGVDAGPVVDEPEVLGERLAQSQPDDGVPAQRSASFLGRPLPFTGSGLMSYGAIAVGLLLAGAGLLATRQRT